MAENFPVRMEWTFRLGSHQQFRRAAFVIHVLLLVARTPSTKEKSNDASKLSFVDRLLTSRIPLLNMLLSRLARCGLLTPVGGTPSSVAHRRPVSIRTAMMASEEVAKAHAAALKRIADDDDRTIFDKILSKEILSDAVYEDELVYAFRDISPQAPIHVLLIPKVRAGLTQMRRATEMHTALLGHMMVVAGQLGDEHCPDGFRLVINDGKQGAQSVYHLHVHLLGGRQLGWPPG